jgi:hypothetical protein
MIKSYCHQDIERGIFLLKLASKRGCVRSSYTLGLILRDTDAKEASEQMNIAAKAEYLPALQELLPAREMKAKYGEPDAQALRNHLDPYCLNRLLGRHYLHCTHLRDVNTSHCWNPLCGRWAYKASSNSTTSTRRPAPFAFLQNNNPPPPPEPPQQEAPAGRIPFFPPRNGAESPNRAIRRGPRRVEHAAPRRGRAASHQVGGSNQGVHAADGGGAHLDVRVSRMKMCSRCCRAKYCSKLCQVYDWRSGRHKMECQFL